MLDTNVFLTSEELTGTMDYVPGLAPFPQEHTATSDLQLIAASNIFYATMDTPQANVFATDHPQYLMAGNIADNRSPP